MRTGFREADWTARPDGRWAGLLRLTYVSRSGARHRTVRVTRTTVPLRRWLAC